MDVNKLYYDYNDNYWKEAYTNNNKIYYYNVGTREVRWNKEENWFIINDKRVNDLNTKQIPISSDYGYGYEDDELDKGNIRENDNKNIDNTIVNDERRPISVVAINGSSWYVVLTGEGKHFYYNHQSRKSQYSRPKDIEDNINVESALQKISERKKILQPRLNIDIKEKLGLHTALQDSLESNTNNLINTNTTNNLINTDNVNNLINIDNNNNVVDIDSTNTAVNIDSTNTAVNINSTNTAVNIDINNTIDGENVGEKKVSYSEKIKLYKELLIEKNISVFGTYESEMEKLKNDYRFNLLNTKDRKQIFNEYLKKRVESEKNEKYNAIKCKQNIFKEFLSNIIKSPNTTYLEIFSKYSNDKRFKIIPKERDRELIFHEYITQLKNNNKSTTNNSNLTNNSIIKENYFQMLSQLECLDSHVHFKRIKKILQNDNRFNSVNENLREIWFDEYIEEKVNKEKLIQQEKIKIEYEKKSIKNELINNNIIDKNNNNNNKLDSNDDDRSIKLENEFNEILTKYIVNPNISWKEAKNHILNKDKNFKNIINQFDKYEYLKLFDKHLNNLNNTIKINFINLLHESNINLSSKFEDTYKLIKNDERCKLFSCNEKIIKNEFIDYKEKLHLNRLKQFDNMLKETKLIDYCFIAKAKLIPSLFDEMYSILQQDQRYLALDDIPEQRSKLIQDYLNKIEKNH